MSLVTITRAQIEIVLGHFHRAGRRGSECVVLFIGKRTGDKIVVVDVVRPDQRAGMDFFKIPPRSMQRLFNLIRKNRLMIAAQAHTHPMKAFHSAADDYWAIIRHQGALSIVLPYFAKSISVDTFVAHMAMFQYSENGHWVEVENGDVHRHFEIRHE